MVGESNPKTIHKDYIKEVVPIGVPFKENKKFYFQKRKEVGDMAEIKKKGQSCKVDGIKSSVENPNLKIVKYRHPAWTTIVYGIPREIIHRKFYIDDLLHDAIYVSTKTDKDGNTTKIYVGQASTRNGGKSVIERLKEHEKDSHSDNWDYTYVFVSLLNKLGDEYGWGADTLRNLEYSIYKKFPARSNPKSPYDINDNGNTPNKGSEISSATMEVLSNIETYLAYLIPDLFAQNEDIKDDTSQIIENVVSLRTIDLQTGYGTRDYTTPEPTVKDMVEMLPKEIFVPESRFFDPACKGGEFLFEIYKRLMKSPALIERYKSENVRSSYILDEQLFGLALSK